MTRRCFVCALLLFLAGSVAAGEPFHPDPLSVRRHEAGYRYPQHGWTVLHIEGQPYDRGLQHGRLMAKEIETYIAALSEHRAPKSASEYWDLYRQLVGGLYLNRFDHEHLEEMKGIADGAAAAGVKVHGKPIDVTDVAGVNLWVELACLDDALRATPSGVDGLKPTKPAPTSVPLPQEHHCSAFAATGPATADGKIVFGHITMWNLHQASHFNVWLDVKPAKGHRIVMQTFPGGIYSGMDYYINSAGVMLTETTLDQTRFEPDGTPLASRARRAMQYGSTIDDVVKELTAKNNGLYTNEWILGDANTNEIAVLEQGTHTYRLRRSSKEEWLIPGVEGFYWGCNNTKGLKVRLETLSSTSDRPEDVSWNPADRDLAWLKVYRDHKGKIDVGFGKLAYSGPPLAKLRSLDAKVTTSALAKELTAHAVFGPPYGRVWEPAPWQKEKYQIIRSMVPNDWTVLTTAEPGKSEQIAADLSGRQSAPSSHDVPTSPAWHGTLLPKSDADLWLTAGFARYERVVAQENARHDKSGGRLHPADRRDIELSLFRYRTDYLTAKAARPAWRTGNGAPPSPLDAELDRARWHREQTAYGVLTLQALRQYLGAEKFAKSLDEFGKANAGQEVTVRQFTTFLDDKTGKDVTAWLTKRGPDPAIGGATFSTGTWLSETNAAMIVYGTAADVAANHAAADVLARAARIDYGNEIVPVVSDTEATDANLKERHVILIGRPATNRIAERFASALPVTFGPGSVKVGNESFAHEGTSVIAAGTNPHSPRYSVVLVAGLSADTTYRACERASFPTAEVCIFPAGGSPLRRIITKADGSAALPQRPVQFPVRADMKSVSPLRRAHAHNDYEHTHPLTDALAQGFCNVEADIYLTKDGLLVGHERKDLKPGRTLEALYLDPLRERVKANGGKVYPNGPAFFLLIDVKTGAEDTYATLDKVLAKYADLLSVTRDGKFTPGAVTVVVSGNRAKEAMSKQTVRYAGIDGRPEDLGSDAPADLIPWISANWNLLFRWHGDGPMPEAERTKLREMVSKAHNKGRLVRFWATPEKEAFWKELLAADVDLINTDKLAELRAYLLANPAK